jgi:hypothetical protein
MDSSLAMLVPLFRATGDLFHRGLEGVSREDLVRRPHDGSNPLLWIAGHALSSRISLTKVCGENIENPWGKIFARGATVDADVSYPEVSEIIALWDNVTEALMKRLEALDDADLSGPSPFPIPTPDNTKRGAIAFLNFHETYHIGQIAYLRKWLGYSALIG